MLQCVRQVDKQWRSKAKVLRKQNPDLPPGVFADLPLHEKRALYRKGMLHISAVLSREYCCVEDGKVGGFCVILR
jgi:hypothetical protein